jgi:transposase
MFHAVVDTNGLPVRLELSAGEAHDYQLALKLLSRLRSGSMLLADRGYDADWIRAFVTKKVLGPTFRFHRCMNFAGQSAS